MFFSAAFRTAPKICIAKRAYRSHTKDPHRNGGRSYRFTTKQVQGRDTTSRASLPDGDCGSPLLTCHHDQQSASANFCANLFFILWSSSRIPIALPASSRPHCYDTLAHTNECPATWLEAYRSLVKGATEVRGRDKQWASRSVAVASRWLRPCRTIITWSTTF